MSCGYNVLPIMSPDGETCTNKYSCWFLEAFSVGCDGRVCYRPALACGDGEPGYGTRFACEYTAPLHVIGLLQTRVGLLPGGQGTIRGSLVTTTRPRSMSQVCCEPALVCGHREPGYDTRFACVYTAPLGVTGLQQIRIGCGRREPG